MTFRSPTFGRQCRWHSVGSQLLICFRIYKFAVSFDLRYFGRNHCTCSFCLSSFYNFSRLFLSYPAHFFIDLTLFEWNTLPTQLQIVIMPIDQISNKVPLAYILALRHRHCGDNAAVLYLSKDLGCCFSKMWLYYFLLGYLSPTSKMSRIIRWPKKPCAVREAFLRDGRAPWANCKPRSPVIFSSAKLRVQVAIKSKHWSSHENGPSLLGYNETIVVDASREKQLVGHLWHRLFFDIPSCHFISCTHHNFQ